jgi:hypothetical protein
VTQTHAIALRAAFVAALPSLPLLQTLSIVGWCCSALPMWTRLPEQLGAMTGLTFLDLDALRAEADSVSWFHLLSASLRQLQSLQCLWVRGESPDDELEAGSPALAASLGLAQAIGSLPRITSLWLMRLPRHLRLLDCYAHLTRLQSLTGLRLDGLARTPVSEGDYEQVPVPDLVSLLACLPQLEIWE